MKLTAMVVNFVYSIIGGLLTLLFMYFGYKWFERLTKHDTSDELAKDSKAMGLVVMGIFVGVEAVIGPVIGPGLT